VDISAVNTPDYQSFGLIEFAYDPNADKGYILTESSATDCSSQSPGLVAVDFAAGSMTSRTLPIGAGTFAGEWSYRIVVDPSTHVAAIATTCLLPTPAADGYGQWRSELSLLELATGALTPVFRHTPDHGQVLHGFPDMPGGDSWTIRVDAVNHLVLQRSMYCPDVPSAGNVNARPCLNVYDERGALVKRIPGLFGGGSYGDTAGLNGTTRTSAALGQEQIGVGYMFPHSFEAQPFSY
jgi:hypothetical protein